jgi:hypothetical protein
LLGSDSDEDLDVSGLFSIDGDFLLAQENSQLYREYHEEIEIIGGVSDSRSHRTRSSGHSEGPMVSVAGGRYWWERGRVCMLWKRSNRGRDREVRGEDGGAGGGDGTATLAKRFELSEWRCTTYTVHFEGD